MSDAARADPDRLKARLERAWSRETSSLWTAETPARGQCGVTALAVQQLCGGEILMTPTAAGPHFYNRIAGQRRDFTAAQFDTLPDYEDRASDAAAAMADTSPAQLEALLRTLERGA